MLVSVERRKASMGVLYVAGLLTEGRGDDQVNLIAIKSRDERHEAEYMRADQRCMESSMELLLSRLETLDREPAT
jgi:hypothetical protein